MSQFPPVDPVDLTAALVRCPSVTPADAGALDILHDLLSDAGFSCAWADRGGIRNLLIVNTANFDFACVFSHLAVANVFAAQDIDSLFTSANKFYQNGAYQEAITAYKKIEKAEDTDATWTT